MTQQACPRTGQRPSCRRGLGLLDKAAQRYCEALQRHWSS